MKLETSSQTRFFEGMSEHQISAREFFGNDLLKLLKGSFDIKDVLISYFDKEGKFLSWTHEKGSFHNDENHPYKKIKDQDVIRKRIYEDAKTNRLTYFDVKPILYKSTEIIEGEHSEYITFMQKHFNASYTVAMGFGINAYIQLTFLKSFEEGDFTEEELNVLYEIYIYVANSYKNFKKHEQEKIISNIKNNIIDLGEKAYLVTDIFMNIMSYNETAKKYLEQILGESIINKEGKHTFSWIPFLLGSEHQQDTQIRVIQDYVFKIYTYNQVYTNGIIDKYHWITISEKVESEVQAIEGESLPLTKTEQRVAQFLYKGFTYKAIAQELVVSYHTVKKHVQNIYLKCGVNSRYQLNKWIETQEK